MPAALDRIYRMNRIFSWADGHLNLNRSLVGGLIPRSKTEGTITEVHFLSGKARRRNGAGTMTVQLVSGETKP